MQCAAGSCSPGTLEAPRTEPFTHVGGPRSPCSSCRSPSTSSPQRPLDHGLPTHPGQRGPEDRQRPEAAVARVPALLPAQEAELSRQAWRFPWGHWDARGSHHTSRRSQAVPPATWPQESSTSRAQSAPAPRFQHSAQHAQPSTGPQGRRPPRPDTTASGLVHGTEGIYRVRWGLPEPRQAVPPRAAGGSA